MNKIDSATQQATQQLKTSFLSTLGNAIALGAMVGVLIWFFDNNDVKQQTTESTVQQPAKLQPKVDAPTIDYGDWKVFNWVDEFGDETGEKGMRIASVGNFDNMFFQNEKLIAQVYLEDDFFSLRFREYKATNKDQRGLFDMWYYCSVKDMNNGDTFTQAKLFNRQNSIQFSFAHVQGKLNGNNSTQYFDEWVKDAIYNEKHLYFVCSNEHQTTYRFKINFIGFNNSMTKMRTQ